MTVYQIDYDLGDPGQDYDELFEAIEALGSACHIMDSVWFVDAQNTSTSEIRDELKEHVDWNDDVLVTKMPSSGGGRWSTTFSNDCTDWLKEHL